MIKEQIDNCIRVLIRKSPFAPTLRRCFRCSPVESTLKIGRKHGWTEAANHLLLNDADNHPEHNDFHSLLRNDINTNIEYEFLLTATRRLLLQQKHVDFSNSVHTRVIETIITQAHHNEFVWYVSREENEILEQIIENSVDDKIEFDSSALVLLSMYGKIGQFDGLTYQRHRELLLAVQDIPGSLNRIFTQLISEHDEQNELKGTIRKAGDIRNPTSRNIAQMYEEYPYPRWIDWDFPQPRTRINKLSNYFSQNELAFVNRPYNVLVAGCGTGSKAIEYAIGYGQNAKITAIDLSLTSLSYAKWKAERHNISNIEFIQMDLLELPELDITFDIVECTGVLHHLKDPAEGARAIIAPVKSNGIVHISLYSDLARKSIVELREKYNLVPDSTSDEIRKKRLEMMMNDADLIDNRLSLRWDFFDLHRCKDLLFHPLEHRYTVPMIESLLSELNLEFRGLEKPPIVRSQHWTHYPARKHMRNLSKWHKFELKHPDAFGNLYEIWSLKTTVDNP